MSRWIVSGQCLTCGGIHEKQTNTPDSWLNAYTGTVGLENAKGVVWIIVNNAIHGCKFSQKRINTDV